MNETLKNLIERRSCRSYRPDPIPADLLDQILEAGTYVCRNRHGQAVSHYDCRYGSENP